MSDSAMRPVDRVSRALDCYRRGDIEGALQLFSGEVRWASLRSDSLGCRSRADVADMLEHAAGEGIDGSIEELVQIGSAVVVGFRRQGDAGGVTQPIWCVLRFEDGSVSRVTPFRDRDAALAAARSAGSPVLLDLLAVSKSFRGRPALHQVSLAVHAGEAVAIVGENGAGKTTLLKICAGLVDPDTGAVDVFGTIGYCPQEPGVLDLLSADQHLVLFGAGVGLSRADALARGRALLVEFGFPLADRTVARHLSGGSRQKLNLALALLGDPSVILLDEPYQGFDRGSYVSFWEHVDRWREQGKAVVVVTHLLTELERVDRIVELKVTLAAGRSSRDGQPT